MNISLPKELKDFVRERTTEKAYSNPSDYIRALIREDQERRKGEQLEALLLEGLESGKPARYDLAELRREVRERLARGQQQEA